MNIRYDIEKMKSIISDFANITGLSIALVDTDFKTIITYAYNTPEFCRKIQNCECGAKLCYHSDMEILRECRRTKRFVSHVCHAGIIDSVMPIFKDMVISGYIMLGRIRPSEDITYYIKQFFLRFCVFPIIANPLFFTFRLIPSFLQKQIHTS